MVKINYLNNRELLREIHKSKISFCSIVDDIYSMFDLIVDDLNSITSDAVKQALQNKADRLTKENRYIVKESKIKTTPEIVNVSDLLLEEVVFRVMTSEHIPNIDESVLVESKKVKTNFPPFKQYIIESYVLTESNEYTNLVFKEVGRSHWDGGLNNGKFSIYHGKINTPLASMFMKLVDRYAQRGNWRGYTYNDEMKGQALLQLSQVGLQFNEAKSSNPFSYYTETINNSFTRVLNIEKKNQVIRDDLLIASNSTPSFSRQHEHEDEARRFDVMSIDSDEIVIRPSRGRKKKIQSI